MPERMVLTITLSKPIPDVEAGRVMYELVKQRFADRPDITVRALVANHFTELETPT